MRSAADPHGTIIYRMCRVCVCGVCVCGVCVCVWCVCVCVYVGFAMCVFVWVL
jgi:hypothetical protein